MKKQRMQADNVQQLMEIVRALQNGEEPDMEKIREKTHKQELEAEEAKRKALEARRAAREAKQQEAEAGNRTPGEKTGRANVSAEKPSGSRPSREKISAAERPGEEMPRKRRSVPAWLVSGTPFAEDPAKETEAARRAAAMEPEVELPPVKERKQKQFDPDSEDAFLRFLEEENDEPPVQVKAMLTAAGAAVSGVVSAVSGKLKGAVPKKDEEESGEDRKSRRERRKARHSKVEEELEAAEAELEEEEAALKDKETAAYSSEAARKEKKSGSGKTESEPEKDLEPGEDDKAADKETIKTADKEADMISSYNGPDDEESEDEDDEEERREFRRPADSGGRRIGRLVSPNWREEMKLEEQEPEGEADEETDGKEKGKTRKSFRPAIKKPEFSFDGIPAADLLKKYWPTLLILLAAVILIAAAAIYNGRSSGGGKEAQTESVVPDASKGPEVAAYRQNSQIILTANDSASGIRAIYYALTDPDDFLNLPSYEQYLEPLSYSSGQELRYYCVNNDGVATIPVREETGSITTEKIVWNEPETAAAEPAVSEKADVPAAPEQEKAAGTEAADESETDAGLDVTAKTSPDGARRVTISAIGDCTLGIDPTITMSETIASDLQQYGPSYFFENTRSIFEADDATFANLEGPFTDATNRASKQFAFKGDANYTDILTDGSVEVVTLANNHIDDYGEEGVTDTQEALDAAGIAYCSNNQVAYLDLNGVKTAFIGIYYSYLGEDYENATRTNIAEAQENGADLIIVAYHWGAEKSHYPDETQTALAHLAIDLGADLIVGHHPHVLQGVEEYNGKYIVYSLGNFCFGGNNYPAELDAMIFQQTFDVAADGTVSDAGIKIIPITTSSSSIGGYNNFQPTLLSGVEAENVIRRINEFSVNFGWSYSEEEPAEEGAA